MIIKFHKKFDKELFRAPHEIQSAFDIRFDLFVTNPHHPLLRNHVLAGQYEGCRSININGDWRAIYEEIDSINGEPYIEFIALGAHSQLYK